MKFGVVSFPGSNCDQDMVHALGNVLGQQVVSLWHKDHDLQGADVVVLPGGFSYGDHLRSGAIARFSPIMEEVVTHANKGGRVLGICNGFQVLCEAGLLAGALLHNDQQKFICKNIHLKRVNKETAVTEQAEDNALCIPIAHGEGRFYANDEVLQELEGDRRVLFRYCDAEGNISKAQNPNGSVNNIAGICNKAGNVFGMMPHPERAVDPLLGNQDGRKILAGLLETVAA